MVALLAASARADNATERVRRHEPKMSYLDNGTIRLGVDLNVGGAITFLARSGSAQNLVNGYDFGRQIQMSYYSGPVPFAAQGKQPKPEWSFIGWNPIQVGDAFGNASKVIAEHNDGQEIHVQCIPMHWPLDNVPGECTYDCWFRLEGRAVHARCRLVNHRPDHTEYPARRQELPAVYTNGPWYRLMTYTGGEPFSGGAVTRIEKDKRERGLWSSWTATENWAALVDDHDFGLGVWIPGVYEFGGGFSGKPGTGGPNDGPTGYIAPHPIEVIDWNIEHEYRYDLIVGKLVEIRRYVYDHAKHPAVPAYYFDHDRRGWHFVNASDAGWPVRGELNVTLDRHNPQLIGPVGFWPAAEAGTLVIDASANTADAAGRVYWRNLGDETFTPEKSAPFRVNGDGSDHACRINLAASPRWKGPVIQVRIDPVGPGGPGEWIRVKSITFEK